MEEEALMWLVNAQVYSLDFIIMVEMLFYEATTLENNLSCKLPLLLLAL